MNGAVPLAKAKVLIVEDDEDQRALLRTLVSRAGCTVSSAESAEAAIELLEGDAPDLVFVDLLLPGIDGWELVRRARLIAPDCAVVVVSVLDQTRFPERVLSLPKPFTREQLLDVLARSLPRLAAS
ncbi:hypothetical protein GCM10027568_08480 [Humibacter soli]